MHHTQQTIKTKNVTCKIWKGRDHLGDLNVDGYRYKHSTPVAEETNSKTGLRTGGNVICIFNVISFTVWVVFKCTLILYESKNTTDPAGESCQKQLWRRAIHTRTPKVLPSTFTAVWYSCCSSRSDCLWKPKWSSKLLQWRRTINFIKICPAVLKL
jgi:hypothetical protein